MQADSKLQKYLNPENYRIKALHYLNHFILSPLDCMLSRRSEMRPIHPPVFILGTPRSGSTLLAQVLTDTFNFGFISNRHCDLFGNLTLAERLFCPARKKTMSDYQSTHGWSADPYAPAECGEFWYRFFRRKPAYVPREEVSARKMVCFRHSVAALTNLQNRPLLFKNLYASLRLGPITQYFPEALFIINLRDEIDTGHSILQGRMRMHGNYETWRSVEPPEIDKLKTLPAYQQVIEQIRRINGLINNDLIQYNIPDKQILTTRYEDLCKNTHKVVKQVETFLNQNGVDMKPDYSVPSSFNRRTKITINEELYNKMVDYVKKTSQHESGR